MLNYTEKPQVTTVSRKGKENATWDATKNIKMNSPNTTANASAPFDFKNEKTADIEVDYK